ncbi:TetR/AcrR family transcriptional regulator [Actinomadura kijaniata]|uniref:TetR/AcrR family transcriptional regulator n=1 Tax=Actinomadura kijaniata TaxID=46161 RepID=UPI00082C1AAD|nr:TetR/AcrR family transcriptional regulator [Actinomadura kijaniata]
MYRTAAETRAHVLGVAGELFYGKGIRATGVDLVAAEAGVAPTTLYRLFSSKDGLVGAYVEHAAQGFEERFEAAVAGAGPDPRDQILAVFDAVFAQIDSEGFRGCALLMALAEFPDADLPAHRNAVAAKSWFRRRMSELTGQLGVEDPAELADHLTLVFEGLNASAQSLGAGGPAKRVRTLVETILSSAAPPPSETPRG